MCAGGTTTQHYASCTVTYPAIRHNLLNKRYNKENSLFQGRVVLQVATDGFAHHGVFTHEHHGLLPQRQTDGLHLLGAHVVCAHDEAFWVIIQKLLQSHKALH